jgi:uncharacterized membrane-anchored protein
MTTQTTKATQTPSAARTMLNKVPEVTIWFWIIKILCTTVGESFADWINSTLGVGLGRTALLFTVVFAVVLSLQMRLDRYVPFVYWLTVVVVSVTGTLYTDLLTDNLGVPLWASTTVFTVLLAGVFGIWYARERTLSIHSIVTVPREAFYWLTVLVTFALGTAAGDWTLELTGWGPGTSVLLPAGLIAVVVLCWRQGAQAVLSFWLAYILTRPLGANIGDYLAAPKTDQGLGLGTAITSVIFLAAILATVAYLTVTRADVIEGSADEPTVVRRPERENAMLGVLAVVALATGLLLHHTSQQPHANAASESAAAPAAPLTASQQAQATRATSAFPAADVSALRTITQDSLSLLQSGDQAGATTRLKALETTWDVDQSRLQKIDKSGWTLVDGQIDDVLTSARAKKPVVPTEQQALTALLSSLR